MCLYVKIFFKKERRDDVFVMDLSTKIWSKWHHKLLQRRAWHRTLVHGSSFIQVGGNTWLEKVCTEKNAGFLTVTTVDLCRSWRVWKGNLWTFANTRSCTPWQVLRILGNVCCSWSLSIQVSSLFKRTYLLHFKFSKCISKKPCVIWDGHSGITAC